MLLALAAAPALLVADIPKARQFGDWLVACDNVRRCQALALPREEFGEDLTMLVTREAAGEAVPEVEIGGAFGDELPATGRWRIDGRLAGREVPPLPVVARSRRLEWVDSQGRPLTMLPLTGASAALRWMDEQQGRAGTRSAIVASGPGQVSAVPQPPRPPLLQTVPASSRPPRQLSTSQIATVQETAEGLCDLERAKADHHRLDERHSLAVVGCTIGAYQGSDLLVIVDESGRWTPALIEQPEEPDPEFFQPSDAYSLVSAAYDPSSRILSSYAKGRGLGDCGRSSAWVWDGRAFRLAYHAALDQCRGAFLGAFLRRWTTANMTKD